MREIETILEEYKRSDFRRRLDLFLEFRSLRKDFGVIERYETLCEKVPEFTKKTGTVRQESSALGHVLRTMRYRCSLVYDRLRGYI